MAMFIADFHTHSTFSDGKMTIAQLVDFYGKLGFGAIAITDHLCEEKSIIGQAAHYLECTLTRENFPKYMKTLQEEGERAWKQYRMVVLPGFELSKNSISNHRSAHILGIGISQYLAADSDALVLARSIREQGGISVAAHPVNTQKLEKQTYHLWNRKEELRNEFDAWEVASGPHLFSEVQNSNLPKLANSDLHHPKQIHAWKTILHCERHPEAILQAIRKQEIGFKFYNGAHLNNYLLHFTFGLAR